MQRKFIVIINHQGFGKAFYAWSNENEVAHVFPSEVAAKQQWHEEGWHKVHAGTVVEITEGLNSWI